MIGYTLALIGNDVLARIYLLSKLGGVSVYCELAEPYLFLCGAPPETRRRAAVPGAVGEANDCSLLLSVLSHLSQLGCQVDGNVFIQGVVRDVREVVQVVEAVHRLPLLGLPQQSVPVKRGHRGGSERGAEQHDPGRPRSCPAPQGGSSAVRLLQAARHYQTWKHLLFERLGFI